MGMRCLIPMDFLAFFFLKFILHLSLTKKFVLLTRSAKSFGDFFFAKKSISDWNLKERIYLVFQITQKFCDIRYFFQWPAF